MTRLIDVVMTLNDWLGGNLQGETIGGPQWPAVVAMTANGRAGGDELQWWITLQ